MAELPQHYADRFGWEEKVAAVAAAFQQLDPQEQERCAVFADNYGRCGAIDYYREKYHLPQAIGAHNNYWLWGPRDYSGEIVLVLGGNLEDKEEQFESVTVVGSVDCTYCMPYENNLKIYLCRRLKQPLGKIWPGLKHYE